MRRFRKDFTPEMREKARLVELEAGYVILQLSFIRREIAIKWSYYTIIWSLSASHLISVEHERLALTCLDMVKAGLAVSA